MKRQVVQTVAVIFFVGPPSSSLSLLREWLFVGPVGRRAEPLCILHTRESPAEPVEFEREVYSAESRWTFSKDNQRSKQQRLEVLGKRPSFR